MKDLKSLYAIKIISLILIVVTGSILIFQIFKLSFLLPKDSESRTMLIQIDVNDVSSSIFNLTQKGSNFTTNQIVLNAVIGTLVKFGPSGLIEPYLAETWEVSSDNKKWIFKLRPGLKCDNDTPITPKLFHQILTNSLKVYASKSTTVMEFENLKGWNEFVQGKSKHIDGLRYSDHNIEFHFNNKPDQFLEILRMPYFGFWIPSHDQEIISSAAYRVKKNGGNNVELELREGWYTGKKESYRKVKIGFSSINEKRINIESDTLIQVPIFSKTNMNIKNAFWITGTPTILDTFVLSPYKNNFFNIKNNREVFLKRIRHLSADLIKSNFFYPSTTTAGLGTTNNIYTDKSPREKLIFAIERSTYSEDEVTNLTKIISYALEGSGASFEVVSNILKDPEWYKKTDSNSYFDARISTVHIGAYPLLTVIKMMFCTNLGVSFPDYNERICSLLNRYVQSDKSIDQEFNDNFNTIINDEAIIIPIAHYSSKWLVSDNINPMSLPATNPYPQFELIKNK